MSELEAVEYVLLLLLVFVVLFGWLARALKTPYPIVMVIGGLVLSFIPAVPGIHLEPDLVFLVILPPLLYASAWTTSWRDFRYNLTSILLLAFGLVGFTTLAVALIAPLVFPGFDWRLGLALGAIVAPTDAIAATAIARRVGLPQPIVDVLEGESLINDASGLLALEFATSILVTNRIPTLANGFLTLLWLIAGGIAIGLAVAWIVNWLEQHIDDAPIEITLSILVPYAAYLAADSLHSSGVLAVVACGLFLSRRSARFFSPGVRIRIWSVWESLVFVLNGLVFILIGLQLPAIRHGMEGYSFSTALMNGAIFSLLLIALRMLWVFPGAPSAYFIRRRLLHQSEPTPPARQVFVVGWTGMRGVVSLAAALALPLTLANGAPFPQRNFLVFLTFCVIVVTLAIQGLTLPPIVRALGLAGASQLKCEEVEARKILAEAALNHLKTSRTENRESLAHLYDDLESHYRQRLTSLPINGAAGHDSSAHQIYVELTLELLRVERENAIRLRDEGRINDEVLRRIERELDLSESRLIRTDS